MYLDIQCRQNGRNEFTETQHRRQESMRIPHNQFLPKKNNGIVACKGEGIKRYAALLL